VSLKNDPDATPGQKLLALYSLLIFSNREYSLSELSGKLRCSKQTVLRLLDQLEAGGERGILREMRKGRAYYRMARPARRPVLALSPEGLEQLALCRDFVLHLLPPEARDTLEDALAKAGALLPEGVAVAELLAPRAAALSRGSIDYGSVQPQLEKIREGMRRKLVVSLRYANRLGAERAVDFAPVRLLRLHDNLYVQGWSVTDQGRVERLRDRPLTLAAQRLKEAALTRRSFASLKLPELPENGDFGFAAEEPFVAVVRFAPGAASVYVRERRWSRDQTMETDSDGRLLLRFTARNLDEVLSWVLSFGPQAEALAPGRLRDAAGNAAAELAAMYGVDSGHTGARAKAAAKLSSGRARSGA
jgi:predicted DNA-binding transcriptional regulator YafY